MDVSTEQRLHADALRGQKAKELLNNELLAEVLQAMENDIYARWKACKPNDSDSMAELWRLLTSTEKFGNILRGYVESGDHAARMIDAAAQQKRGLMKAVSNWS